jgi:hypothetical protein
MPSGKTIAHLFGFASPDSSLAIALILARERGGQPFSVGENNFSGIRLIAEAMRRRSLQLTRTND